MRRPNGWSTVDDRKDGRMGERQGTVSEPIRQPRDRLTGQPQERQHRAAKRDAGPTAPAERFKQQCKFRKQEAANEAAPFVQDHQRRPRR